MTEQSLESLIAERNNLWVLATRRAIRPTAAINARLRQLDKRIQEKIPLQMMVTEDNSGEASRDNG